MTIQNISPWMGLNRIPTLMPEFSCFHPELNLFTCSQISSPSKIKWPKFGCLVPSPVPHLDSSCCCKEGEGLPSSAVSSPSAPHNYSGHTEVSQRTLGTASCPWQSCRRLGGRCQYTRHQGHTDVSGKGWAKVCADVLRKVFFPHLLAVVASPLASRGSTDWLRADFALHTETYRRLMPKFPLFILQFCDLVTLSKVMQAVPSDTNRSPVSYTSRIPQCFLISLSCTARFLHFTANQSLQERFVNFTSVFSGLKFFFGISIDFAEWHHAHRGSE